MSCSSVNFRYDPLSRFASLQCVDSLCSFDYLGHIRAYHNTFQVTFFFFFFNFSFLFFSFLFFLFFFLVGVFVMFLTKQYKFADTLITKRLKISSEKSDNKLFWLKVVIACVAYIGFIIYIPVGLAIVCPFVKDSSGNWDYRGCLQINTMRTSAQFITVISLLFYVGFVRLQI